MTEQTIKRTGNRLDITGSVRLPHGNQLDFSDYHEAVGSVTLRMDPACVRPGVYFAEVTVDESSFRISLPTVPGTDGSARFTFVPPLPTPQVYGLRYYRVHGGLRYNQQIEAIIP